MMSSILRAAQAISLLGLAILTYLSLTPLQTVPINDKFAHMLGYALLSLAMASGWGKTVGFGAIGCALVVYGVILEALQDLSPYRTFEVADMVANFIGIIVGLAGSRLLLAVIENSRSSRGKGSG